MSNKTTSDEDGAHLQKMSNKTTSDEDGAHLAEIPDGAGCTEIWERLSRDRDE